MARILKKEANIDISYYEKLAEDAKEAISKYGDFERFTADAPYIPDNFPPDDDDLPF